LPTNWQQITISLAALGVDGESDFDGFWIGDRTGKAQPPFYLDDIVLMGGLPLPPVTNATAHVTVDAQASRHPISDLIYGLAFASSNQLTDLNSPLNRSGGNSETRYNWQLNAHNRGADWYFESIADSPATPGAAGDSFVTATRAAGADAMLTIPMIGWAPKVGANRGKLASYSIAKYGPQTGNDAQWYADAGNGISVTNNTPITWNDPNDANLPVDSTFQQDWVRHLTNRWGLAAQGGVRYYCLDNEWSIWHSTHRDVHPVGATMREVRDTFFEYAEKVKALDPGAWIVAPEEWGWSGYLYSGYDQQWAGQHGWNNLPDRATNGGWDYLPWFLDQARRRETATGQRLLDVFSVHWYPQNGEFSDDTSRATRAKRNRSTRSLWDTNYVDQSWINTKVKLIPRLKSWVATNYPGTLIGITEYNWGAENHVNGATAQADVLGILGREGLDLATRWTTPASNTPTYKAIKLYRNYDGHKSAFGQISVSAGGSNPDSLAVFAAERTNDAALTIMAINKTNAYTPLNLSLTNFASANAAQAWQLTASNLILRLPDLNVSNNAMTAFLPPQSVTLFVVPAQPSAPRLHCGKASSDQNFPLILEGTPGRQYVIQASPDLSTWTAVSTNLLSSNSLPLLFPRNATQQFYRAMLKP
jgi:hypothetical protein